MASAEKVEIFDVSADKIYKVLTDYESYPDFMDGVKSVNVISRDGGTAKVEYNINIIKKFSYVLTSEEVENEKVAWSFDSGDLFSANNGSWNLKDNGDGTTQVTYKVDIDFKVKVPGMISKKLVSSNLPSMMKSVLKKAKSL
jgi:ribosome-associated toxin RatA of RatAB toxin-antitoxin module